MPDRQTLAALCIALLIGFWPGTAVAQTGSQIEAADRSMGNLALNRPTRQSSTDFGGSASRAVDGRTDGNWANNSVSHTRIELEPWWEVDLQQDSLITRVSLFNRTDCCSERLNNAIIIIYDANRRVVTRRPIGTAHTAMPFDMRVRGRYVRVQLPGREYLSLAEVRVFGQAAPTVNPNIGNLALNRPTRQSSTDFGGSASRAVDGRTDGNWANNSVSHTRIELEPWWEVDLQQDSLITRVSLFNRTDCCSERLNNAIIIIYDANRRVVTRRPIGTAHTAMPFDMRVRGRYVRVQLPGREYLSLAEVRVFGQAAPTVNPNIGNLALNRPTRQSSTDFGGSASRAVDGRTDGNWANNSVSHTRIELEPWWEVDLQQDSLITRVSLFNRTDCCSERLNNAIIIIYDANRRVVTRRPIGTAHTAMPFDMRVRGRYVRVQLPGREYLSLAEVRVFGRSP